MFFGRTVPFVRAKAVGSEALLTRRNLITDRARNTDSNSKIREIFRRNVTESAHRVINKLGGQGRKRKWATYSKREGKAKTAKKQPARRIAKEKNTKTGIF